MTYLILENIKFAFDKEFRLEKINLNIRKGEITAIVGPSGSGKSTLLKIILGDLIPDSGKINLDNNDITSIDIGKRKIGYCPQDLALFPHLNVYDNIAFGLKVKKLNKNEIKDIVNRLGKVAEINQLLKRKIHQISGGQKQRVAILRAIAINPKVLLLDEPFHNIDNSLKEQLAFYIKKIQGLSGLTTIFVTHDINEAKLIADNVVVMNEGKILQIGTPEELTLNPKSIEIAKSMGLKNIFDKKDGALFSNKNIDLYIRIDPTQLEINDQKSMMNLSFPATIISVYPDINSKSQTIIVKIDSEELKVYNILNDITMYVIKPINSKTLEVNSKIHLEIPIDAIQIY